MIQGKLIRSDEQEWAKSLPEGSHRMPASWLKNRYEWMVDGAPQKSEWKKCGAGVKGPEDTMDLAPESGKDEKLVLKSWAKDPELKQDPELLSGVPERSVVLDYEEEEKFEFDENIQNMRAATDQARKNFVEGKYMKDQTSGSKEKQKKKEIRAMTRKYARKVLKAWKHEQRELLSVYSRKQLLAAMIPVAGAKKNKKKMSGDKKKPCEVND